MSAQITVKLPDGTPLELPAGASGADAAAAIGPRLAKDALAVRADGELRDLGAPLPDGAEISIVTAKSKGEDAEAALWLIRHDAAHVMATAVTELWPGTKVSIGPPIADGFYYDFEFPEGERPSEADLERIEAKMREHVEADEPFERSELAATEAIERFRDEEQPYKVELIEDLVRDEGTESVSLYRNGPVHRSLPRAARALDRADRRLQAQLARRGVLARRREAPDADPDLRHRVSLQEGARPPSRAARAGARERSPAPRSRARPLSPARGGAGHALLASQRHRPAAPDRARGSRAADEARIRGDQDPAGARRRAVAPLRALGQLPREHVLRRGSRARGRGQALRAEADELPRRLSRLRLQPALLPRPAAAPCRVRRRSRYEREGVLHGLLRVRAFTQDDGHIYCTMEQIPGEVDSICAAIDELYSRFGFEDVRVELSTRPEKSIGSDEQWEQATEALRDALERQGRDFDVSPGEGTFYGPKIDFHITDALGRSWQCGTCQIDFFMPERFGLTYQGADNAEHRPVMIHRALLGSMERFAGILIEHYGGRFPGWLAPTQVAVLPVSDQFLDYARRVGDELGEHGVRLRVDDRSESVGRKIRDAELAKIPFMLVVGEREEAAGTVSVRAHERGDLGATAVADIPGLLSRSTLSSAA